MTTERSELVERLDRQLDTEGMIEWLERNCRSPLRCKKPRSFPCERCQAAAMIRELEAEVERLNVVADVLREEGKECYEQRHNAEQRADRLFMDRHALLNLKTTEGMSAAEWQMRTATAERRARDAERALEEARAALDSAVRRMHEAQTDAAKQRGNYLVAMKRLEEARADSERLRERAIEYAEWADWLREASGLLDHLVADQGSKRANTVGIMANMRRLAGILEVDAARTAAPEEVEDGEH